MMKPQLRARAVLRLAQHQAQSSQLLVLQVQHQLSPLQEADPGYKHILKGRQGTSYHSSDPHSNRHRKLNNLLRLALASNPLPR